MISRMLTLLVLGLVAAATAWAGPAATVIAVEGQALYRDNGTQEWQAIQVGDELTTEATLRTETEGRVVLLQSDGALVRVPAGEEQPLGSLLSAGDQAEGWRFFEVLRELFADSTTLRAGASRGVVSADRSADELRVRFQAQRDALLAKEQLARADIPVLMETAAYYSHAQAYDTVVALVDKMAADFGDEPGFGALAARTRDAEAHSTWLRLQTFRDGEVAAVPPGASLESGSGVQIAYGSDRESYLHVVLYSVPADGAVSSRRIHPTDVNTARPVPARTEVRLPSQAEFYVLDDRAGAEYVVAWSCSAPMDEATQWGWMESAVAAKLGNATPPSESDLVAMAPDSCPRAFVRGFAHTN